MPTINKKIFFGIFLFLFFLHTTSQAATLCSYIRFWDERTDYDNDSKHISSYYQSNRFVHRAKILIYDKNGSCRDGGSCGEIDDIFRGSIYTDDSGYFCTTGIPNGDNVYFKSQMENIYGTVKKSDGTTYQVTSQILATNISGTQTVHWNITCYDETDGLCNNQSQIDSDYPLTTGYVSILESVYDGAKYFDDNYILNVNSIDYPDGQEFIFKYPHSATNCDNASDDSKSLGFQYLCSGSDNYDDNHIIAHELGHSMHKRAMNYSSTLSGGSCATNYSWSTVNLGDKCAISEGFAWFVTGAVYWEENSSGPWVRSNLFLLEGNTTQGNGGVSKKCVNYLNDPHLTIGNGARFFWDLFDSTEVGTDENSLTDDSNLSFYNITNEWDSFPSGTQNRQNNESGLDGRNSYDYHNYNNSVLSELEHNCLDDQAP